MDQHSSTARLLLLLLLAVVDADYSFLFVDRVDDSGVYNDSKWCELLENNGLGLLRPKPLPGKRKEFPFVIVGDDAFPLKECLLKPYPNKQYDIDKRVFNYRLLTSPTDIRECLWYYSKQIWCVSKGHCLGARKSNNNCACSVCIAQLPVFKIKTNLYSRREL